MEERKRKRSIIEEENANSRIPHGKQEIGEPDHDISPVVRKAIVRDSCWYLREVRGLMASFMPPRLRFLLEPGRLTLFSKIPILGENGGWNFYFRLDRHFYEFTLRCLNHELNIWEGDGLDTEGTPTDFIKMVKYAHARQRDRDLCAIVLMNALYRVWCLNEAHWPISVCPKRDYVASRLDNVRNNNNNKRLEQLDRWIDIPEDRIPVEMDFVEKCYC